MKSWDALDIYECLFPHFVKSVPIFPHSDWIRRNTPYLSLFSSNAGKYGPGKLRIQRRFMESQPVYNFLWSTIEAPEQCVTCVQNLQERHERLQDVALVSVKLEQISHISLVFPLVTLSK